MTREEIHDAQKKLVLAAEKLSQDKTERHAIYPDRKKP